MIVKEYKETETKLISNPGHNSRQSLHFVAARAKVVAFKTSWKYKLSDENPGKM